MNYDLAQLMKKALGENKLIIKSASNQDMLSPEHFEEIFGISFIGYVNDSIENGGHHLDPRVAYILKMIAQNTENVNTNSEKRMTSGLLSKETIKKKFEYIFGSPITKDSILKILKKIMNLSEKYRERNSSWDYEVRIEDAIDQICFDVLTILPFSIIDAYANIIKDKEEEGYGFEEDRLNKVAENIANGFEQKYIEEFSVEAKSQEEWDKKNNRTIEITVEDQIKIVSDGLLSLNI